MKATVKDNPTIAKWYQDLYGSATVSRNRWVVVGLVALLLATLEAVALIVLTPLKEVKPYIIQLENSTGMTSVLRPLEESAITQTEALSKFFIVKYVVARETEDAQDQAYHHDQVRLMSTLEETARFEGERRRLEETRDSHLTRTVRISSVSFLNQNTAQVRFVTVQKQVTGQEKPESAWIATLSFRYVNAPMEESDRLNNPLGFQVKAYRVDQEVIP